MICPLLSYFPLNFRGGKSWTADSCASSLKACDPDDFPNLYMLLKIAATLPVTTCECERAISTMRRLNNYMRCTMGESRLSSLALMHIKYDMPVNLQEIVNLFRRPTPEYDAVCQLVVWIDLRTWQTGTYIYLSCFKMKQLRLFHFDLPKMGLKMREIGFQRTYVQNSFQGSMPPDTPRKVRLRRTITFSMTYEHPLENLSYAPDYTSIVLAGCRCGE